MTIIHGITVLLIYQLAGEITALLLALPIPGPVLGMIYLFITLAVRGQAGDSVSTAATALLSHLSLLFVPAGVGLMVHWNRLADEWLAVTAALVASTIITLVFTAAVMRACTALAVRSGHHDA